jgi:hypothetical protein
MSGAGLLIASVIAPLLADRKKNIMSRAGSIEVVAVEKKRGREVERSSLPRHRRAVVGGLIA